MLGKAPNQEQNDLFKANLKQILHLQHPLIKLANSIKWKQIELEFAPLYSHLGLPSHPIRKMVGLLLIKYAYNFSDESLVERWKENPYFQYFSGEATFQWKQPCAASDLVHFRNRLGKEGIEKLLKLTIQLHQDKVKAAKTILVDTTVQEKNVTYPTDAGLYTKIISKCNRWAKKAGIQLRQSYRRTVQKLSFQASRRRLKNGAQQAKRAVRKLKTLAGRQVRDITRQLTKLGNLASYEPMLRCMHRILSQKRSDKDKVYSLHAPHVSCIAKGKAHKKYEFGAKVSIATLPGSNLIVGMQAFPGNPHDGKTLSAALSQAEQLSDKVFSNVIVDKGYRGHGISDRAVLLPGKGQHSSPSARYRHKQQCKSRSSVEAVISHVKRGHRLGRNFLKGQQGDSLNALLAGVGFNLHLWLRELATQGS